MAGLSPALLDAVDARIKAERQGLPVPPLTADSLPQRQQPAVPAQVSAIVPKGSPVERGEPSALGTGSDRMRARQEGHRQAWEARQAAMREPLPEYAVRGASPPPVADLMAQSQQWVDGIRQPEWWAGLLAYPIAERHRWTPYLDAMVDPMFREVRRASVITQYRQSLAEAAAKARHGDEETARYWLRRADTYRRYLEALERGDYGQSLP